MLTAWRRIPGPPRDRVKARLLRLYRALLAEPARLKEMGERARTLAIPDAAERLVAVLLDVAA